MSTARAQGTSMDLPTEVIHHIVSCLSPHDLIHLQRVSKQFHTLVNDLALWQMIYRNARLPRPPGPFPWQSLRFLQRTLVHSSRLEATWTSNQLKVVSNLNLRLPPTFRPFHWKWAFARWLLVSPSEHQIVSRDGDTGFQQTLWASDNVVILSWEVCSIVCAQGPLVYLGLRLGPDDGSEHQAVKLLEFRANNDSGCFSGPVVINVPVLGRWNGLQVHASTTDIPFICVFDDKAPRKVENRHALILDVRNKVFYAFPGFNSQLIPIGGQDEAEQLATSRSELIPGDIQILLTMTHVMTITHYHLNDEQVELLQAFLIPEDPYPDQDGVYELRLSHETIHDEALSELSLIRKPIVDPISGTTTIHAMHVHSHHQSYRSLGFRCIEFTLPRPSDGKDLTSISVDANEVFDVKGTGGPIFFQTSDDGFLRGLFLEECALRSNIGLILAAHYSVRKFTIDCSGDMCIGDITVQYAGSPQFAWQWQLGRDQRGSTSFDGTRGRLNFVQSDSQASFEEDPVTLATTLFLT